MITNATLMCHAPIVIPELAGARGQACAATTGAMRKAARALIADDPGLIVVVTPHGERKERSWGISHQPTLRGDLGRFGHRELSLRFEGSPQAAQTLSRQTQAVGLAHWELPDAGCDHGAFVPLYFVAQAGYRGQVLLVNLPWPGSGTEERFGQLLADCFSTDSRRIAVLASGDMSHRLLPDAPAGYHPQARVFDQQFVTALRRGDYHAACNPDPGLQDLAAEDVVDSVRVAASATGYSDRGGEVLCYEGPFGVGYTEAVLFDAQAPPRALLHLAREAIAAWLENRTPERPSLEPMWQEPRASFVTLRTASGELRGCIGKLAPTKPSMVDEVIENAVGAASRDPRFPPLKHSELSDLRIELSVLEKPRPVAGIEQLDPATFGVVVSHAGRRGVLLPEIDGVDDAETQVRIASQKAGIAEGAPVELRRFRVRKLKERPR